MQNDNIDLTEQNIVGAIDRFLTNIALAGLAVVPTALMVVLTPWRLVPLLTEDRADGRDGALLAPGVFFPLVAAGSLLLLGLFVPEITAQVGQEGSGSANASIGGDDIVSLTAALQTGEFNRIILILLPIFFLTVLSFTATAWLRILIGSWWTIRVAIRSGFYIFGALLGWACATVTVLARFDLLETLGGPVSSILSNGALVLFAWCFFWIFRKGGDLGIFQTIGVAFLAMISSILGMVLAVLLIG